VETKHSLHESLRIIFGFGSGDKTNISLRKIFNEFKFQKYGFSKRGLNFIKRQKIIEIKWSCLSSQLSFLPRCTVYVSTQQFDQMSNYFPFVLLRVSVPGIQTHEISPNFYGTS